jgi:zinc protease
MLFNGLTHFPGNSLVQEMQRLGMDIGPHINAYASIEMGANGILVRNPVLIDVLSLFVADHF